MPALSLLLMAALGLLGVDSVHELNGMKVLVACIANFSAVVTFVASHAVAWHYCVAAERRSLESVAKPLAFVE